VNERADAQMIYRKFGWGFVFDNLANK